MRELGDYLTCVPTGDPGTEQGPAALGDPVGRGIEHASDLRGIGEGG